MTPSINAAVTVLAWSLALTAIPPSTLAAARPAASPPALEQARERRPPERPRAEPRQAPRPAPRARPAPWPAPHPAPRPPVPTVRGQVVFIGGYFYDPFFGPYPWWPRPAYPFWYFPVYDHRAEVRIDCREKGAAVYVDGFYAGIVDDFDHFFQRLPLPPGGHRITLYLEGFETADYSVYLRPGSTFTVHHVMMRLPAGLMSRRPEVAPPVPPPPEGTYAAPSGASPLPPTTPAPLVSVATGWLDLDVQPDTATVFVDGERWVSSGEGLYELQLPVGTHRIEVTAPGYRAYTGTVDLRDDQHVPVHVSLTRER